MKNIPVLVLLLTLLALGCNKENSSETNLSPLKISFRLLAYGAPIDTSRVYTNFSGQRFKVSNFKFYVSLLELRNDETNLNAAENESYHLVDLLDASSQQFTVNLKQGVYNQFRFIVGVDSVRNVSGAQTGALDPARGMFWTWNTGYIFAKLEGWSPVSSAPFQAITYHIGGFRPGESAIRTVTLPVDIQVGRASELVINADIEKWFDGVHTISIAQQAAVMSPGGLAGRIADNYATMFTVERIVNP